MRIRIYIKPANVKIILMRRGKELSWLMERLEVSDSHFYNIMAQRRQPSAIIAKRIIKHLPGVPWDDIFKVEEATCSTT